MSYNWDVNAPLSGHQTLNRANMQTSLLTPITSDADTLDESVRGAQQGTEVLIYADIKFVLNPQWWAKVN